MQSTTPTVLDGEWVGTIHMDGDDSSLRVRFAAHRQRITGSIDLLQRRAKRSELTRVTVAGDRVHFVWKRNGEKMIFDASLDGEQMRGGCAHGSRSLSLRTSALGNHRFAHARAVFRCI